MKNIDDKKIVIKKMNYITDLLEELISDQENISDDEAEMLAEAQKKITDTILWIYRKERENKEEHFQ